MNPVNALHVPHKADVLRCAVAALGIACVCGEGADSGLRFRGSMYADLGAIHTVHESESDEFDVNGVSRFSLDIKSVGRRKGKVEGLVDLVMPYGVAATRLTDAAGEPGDSVSGGRWELFAAGSAPVLVDLRKLYLSIYLPFADITMGRQIVNFGRGMVFSPIDIFSTVEVLDITFRRRGSDIVNGRIPLGPLSGVDLTAGLPGVDNAYAAAARAFTLLGGWDVAAVGMYRDAGVRGGVEDKLSGGVSAKGDIEIGVYGEIVGHRRLDSRRNALEAMAGADYSLRREREWFFTLEYLYRDPVDQADLWGNHNAFGSVRYVINDLMNVSISAIAASEPDAVIGSLRYFYNVLQNVDVTLYAQGVDNAAGTYVNYAVRCEVKF